MSVRFIIEFNSIEEARVIAKSLEPEIKHKMCEWYQSHPVRVHPKTQRRITKLKIYDG